MMLFGLLLLRMHLLFSGCGDWSFVMIARIILFRRTQFFLIIIILFLLLVDRVESLLLRVIKVLLRVDVSWIVVAIVGHQVDISKLVSHVSFLLRLTIARRRSVTRLLLSEKWVAVSKNARAIHAGLAGCPTTVRLAAIVVLSR